MMQWQFHLATDIGGRADQQDRAEVISKPTRKDEHLVVLADGMGGQQDGALASQAVVDTAKTEFLSRSITNPQQFLTDLCFQADRAIRDIGAQRNSNPASTCTALYLSGNEAYWTHVGDSRLYHFRADRLLGHTNDHTINELLKNATSGADEYLSAQPIDNRLYMCLGGDNELEPDFGATAVGDHDWFMLCSDGFWSQVDAKEVTERRLIVPAEHNVAVDLAAVATHRGGAFGDNVSVALATYRPSRLRETWLRLTGNRSPFNR